MFVSPFLLFVIVSSLISTFWSSRSSKREVVLCFSCSCLPICTNACFFETVKSFVSCTVVYDDSCNCSNTKDHRYQLNCIVSTVYCGLFTYIF